MLTRERIIKAFNRRAGAVYAKRLGATTWTAPVPERTVDVHVVTLCGHRDAAQAMAMLMSFMRHVGRPTAVTVGSDGSLTPEDAALVRGICPQASVVVPEIDGPWPEAASVHRYADSSALGRKLALMIQATAGSLATPGCPTLLVDSDVLFFPAAERLPELIGDGSVPRYMREPNTSSFDSRADLAGSEPANSGFVVLASPFDWGPALSAMHDQLESPTWYTEQTTVRLALHFAGGKALEHDAFVLRYDDARSLRDHATRPGVVARHYVAPIRWKFWIIAFGGYGRTVFGVVTGR